MEVKRRMASTLMSTECTAEARKDLHARTRFGDPLWTDRRVAFPPSSLELLCINIASLELPMCDVACNRFCRIQKRNKTRVTQTLEASGSMYFSSAVGGRLQGTILLPPVVGDLQKLREQTQVDWGRIEEDRPSIAKSSDHWSLST